MKNILIVFSVMFLLVWGSTANALTVNYLPSPAQTTAGVYAYATTFDMMAGMSVKVTWGDDSISDFTWSSPGGLAGGVSDLGGFTLGSIGDSYSQSWVLGILEPYTSKTIQSIFIDAGTGNAVFDVLKETEGTANSGAGYPFTVTNSTGNFDITATYSGTVQIGSAAPVGDLYRYLNIDFTSTAANYQGYFGVGDYLTFRADTDNLMYENDIAPVPEPATMLLLGTGFAGLIGFRLRKKKK